MKDWKRRLFFKEVELSGKRYVTKGLTRLVCIFQIQFLNFLIWARVHHKRIRTSSECRILKSRSFFLCYLPGHYSLVSRFLGSLIWQFLIHTMWVALVWILVCTYYTYTSCPHTYNSHTTNFRFISNSVRFFFLVFLFFYYNFFNYVSTQVVLVFRILF